MTAETEAIKPTLDADAGIQLQSHEMQGLGLEKQPFPTTIDSNNLFHDPQIEMTNNICAEYLEHPSLSLLLLGESGSGKTSLLRQLLANSFQKKSYCVLRAKQGQTYLEICEKLLAQWGDPIVPVTSDAVLIEAILNRENPSAALLIDDADQLNSETLVALMRLKSTLQQEHRFTLGLLFAGQSFLRNTVSECEKIDADVSTTYQINLRPLSHEQTELYIQQRLAGLTEDNTGLLSSKDMQAIIKVSAGNFGQIQIWVLRALRAKLAAEPFKPQLFSEKKIKQASKFRRLFWYAGLMLVLLIVLLILFMGQASTPINENEVYSLSLPSNEQSLSTQVIKPKPLSLKSTVESPLDAAIKKTQAQNKDKNSASLKGLDWLKSLTVDAYTLQLVASRKVENLALIKKHVVNYPTAYFEKPINGVTFYIFVLGSFNSAAEANQVIASLPEEIQAYEPWPISLAGLQNYIH